MVQIGWLGTCSLQPMWLNFGVQMGMYPIHPLYDVHRVRKKPKRVHGSVLTAHFEYATYGHLRYLQVS